MDKIIVANLEANITRLVDQLNKVIEQLKEEKSPTIIREDGKIIEFLQNFKIEKVDNSNLVALLEAINTAVNKPEKSISIIEGKAIVEALTAVKKAVSAQDLSVNIDTGRIEELLSQISQNTPVISIPDTLRLPDDQIEALKPYEDYATKKGQKEIVEAIENIRIGGGGGGSMAGVATEATLEKLVGDYAIQIDEAGALTYIGKASVGSGVSSPVWQIKVLDTSSGLIIRWADGDSLFDNIWDDRESLNYL